MNDLSTLANMAEILGVIIVVGGLFFAVLQMRQIRQQRRELAAIELFRFFGNPRFTRAYQLLLHLPDGLATDDTRTKQKDLEDAAMLVSSTMENIGVMTLWRKLENWAVALRNELDDEAAFEWFQWLAERLEDYQARDPHPAYEAHKDWMPAHLRHEI
jgi:hypothetical protein